MDEPLFLKAAGAAKLCCRSEGSWWGLNRQEKTPASFKMGGSTLWMRSELLQWVAAGCPDRATWEASKKKT